MYGQGYAMYRRTDVMTADQKKLVLMCYEGAVRQLKVGKRKAAEKDFEGKAAAFSKAIDIVNELMCSLDYEKGGEIARNLASLYRFVLDRIMRADMERNMTHLDAVFDILEELRSAWENAFGSRPPEAHMLTEPRMDTRANGTYGIVG